MEKQLRGDSSTLRFWHRTDKPTKNGFAPVHLVYQLHSNKRCFSIQGTSILPVNWNKDEENGRFVFAAKEVARKYANSTGIEIDYTTLPSKDDIKKLNLKLAEVELAIEQIENRYRSHNQVFNCDNIIADLKEELRPLSTRVRPESNITDFIDRYISESNQHKKGTLKEYTTISNHLKDFQRSKRKSLTFENIDVSQMKAFHNFLLEKREVRAKNGKKRIVQINNITIAKILSTLRTLLRRAEGEYDISVNPKYRNFKNPHPRKDGDLEVIALTEEEVMAISNLDLSENKRLDEARDLYLFSIATGLRYGDLWQLEWQHIKKDNTIRMASSDKNAKNIDIPLNPISFSIIKKYIGQPRPLPSGKKGKILSNQKLNDYIKEIGELASIDTVIEVVREIGTKKVSTSFKKYELLSIHTGRKTFTSLSLEKGIPLQDVMSLTTHSSFNAVKRYINVTMERKKTVMAEAWGAVNPLKIAK